MSTAPRPAPPRPAYAPLQSSGATSQSSSVFQSYSSSTNLAAQPPAPSAAPLPSPTSSARLPQNLYGSLDGQAQQSQQEQPQMPPMQRYRSFEFQPNRDGAGRTAAETQSYLNQAALLAEAAKRAQMAVVMRDLDSMEL